MIRKLSLILALILVPSVLIGQNNTTRFFPAYDHEDLTVAGTAIGFTAGKVTSTTNSINEAAMVLVTITCASGTTCPVNFLYDSGTPTSSVGENIDAGQSFTLYGHQNIVNFLAIRTTSTSAILHVIYHR